MLDHRTAAAAGAPPAHRPATASLATLVLTDGTHAFRPRLAVHGRRIRVVLRERPGCSCGCRGGWSAHLAYVQLLRLRVQTWTPDREVA
jgi:hypothetical protein